MQPSLTASLILASLGTAPKARNVQLSASRFAVGRHRHCILLDFGTLNEQFMISAVEHFYIQYATAGSFFFIYNSSAEVTFVITIKLHYI